MDAVRFAIGYETLQVSYRAAREGLDHRSASAEQIARARWGYADGEEPSRTPGEDGWSDHDQFWAEVGEIDTESQRSVTVVNEAFTIGLFQMWERHANKWCGVHQYSENETFSELKAIGRQPDESNLVLLRLLANCLKHGASAKPNGACNQLLATHGHLLDVQPNPDGSAPLPSSEHLIVTGSLLNELFRAVIRSGPPSTRFNDSWPLKT